MSATQIVLVILVLFAFALGWVARGRRESPASDRPDRNRRATEALDVDAALGASLTAFQAALALWQADEPATSPLGARTLATFAQQREVVSALAAENPSLARAQTALDHLSVGLAAWAQDEILDPDRERKVLRAERMLSAARSAFLLDSLSTPPGD